MGQQTSTISRKTSLFRKITNFFGIFGYLFCALQWLWATTLYLESIIDLLRLLNYDNNPIDKTPVVTYSNPDLFAIIFMVTITIIMIAISIYAIIKLPSTIAKTGKKIVHETAEAATPLVIKAQHKKDTKKFHIKITSRLVLAIKIFLIVAPIIMTITSQFLGKQAIEFPIAMIVSLTLASLCSSSFLFQYILADIFHIKTQELW